MFVIRVLINSVMFSPPNKIPYYVFIFKGNTGGGNRLVTDGIPNVEKVEAPMAVLQDQETEYKEDSNKNVAYKLALHTAQCLHTYAKTGNINDLLMSMRHLVALPDEQGDK